MWYTYNIQKTFVGDAVKKYNCDGHFNFFEPVKTLLQLIFNCIFIPLWL